MFQAAFLEGNISRTTRDESIGVDWETELELHADEVEKMKDVKEPMGPTNMMAGAPGLQGLQGPTNGRPLGSQNVPVNNRNSGVRPPNQKPTSKLQKTAAENELMDDEAVIALIDKIAVARNIVVTPEMLTQIEDILET
jgi:hypothetical protein